MKISRISLLLLTAPVTLLALGGFNCLYPKASFTVVSQGTASMATVNLVADGGSPVPPVPPGTGLVKAITAAKLMLSADGGSPVPPVPTGFAG